MDELLGAFIPTPAVFNPPALQGGQTSGAGTADSSVIPAPFAASAPVGAPVVSVPAPVPATIVEVETVEPVTLDYELGFDETSGLAFVTVLDEEGEPIRRIPPDLNRAFLAGGEVSAQTFVTL